MGREQAALVGQRREPLIAEPVPQLAGDRLEPGSVGAVERAGREGGGEDRAVQHGGLVDGAGGRPEGDHVPECDPEWSPGPPLVPSGDSGAVVADRVREAVAFLDRERTQRDLGQTGEEVVADAAGEIDGTFEERARAGSSSAASSPSTK